MAGNRNLNTAAKAKKDKFYTQLEDIENELRWYREFFIGKTILCNCDDPFESNFFKYFAAKFNDLELKKLITTSYADSPIAGLEINLFPDNKTAYMTEVTELRDWTGDGRESIYDVEYAIKHGIYKTQPLIGDMNYCAGDFRSKECIELLKQADVVVTNPPFSVFREFVALMIKHNKKFIILGNKNALTYKEIFPLIMQNKIWTGFTPWAGGMWFISDHEDYYDEIRDGVLMKNVASIWFTNFDISKFREEIALYKKYSPEEYPRYDNYDAIEVSKTAEIPEDYFGVMGVPITFLDKYDPRQFEILGDSRYHDGKTVADDINYVNGKLTYRRILIRRRTNFKMTIDEMRRELQRRLNKKRFAHSIGVANTAVKLAKRFGVDETKAYVAGLLHDCAREFENDELPAQADIRGIKIGDVERAMPLLLHPYIGAKMIREIYGVNDAEISQAIWRHTVGAADMTALDKIIYFADMIEPNRNYPGVEKLRDLAETAELDEILLTALSESIIFVVQKNSLVHPETIAARNFLLLNKNS